MNSGMNTTYLPKGSRLNNRYIIDKVLGSGGFGITYMAFDLLLNSNVAIKEFFVDKAMRRDTSKSLTISVAEEEAGKVMIEKSLANFMNEIRVMRSLQNVPYISHFRDSFSENGTEYIVMNMFNGRTLSEYAANRTEAVKVMGSIFRSANLMEAIENVLIALEEMHSLGIIHRDISPGNLFLTEDGDLYLIDFGTATSLDENSEIRNNQFFEHKGFQAPEYRQISEQGPWTDIYSLCASIVYMITGEGVPEPDTRRISDPVPLMLMKSKLSARQQNALLKGLNVDIGQRYSDVTALRKDLCGEPTKAMQNFIVSYCAGTDIGDRHINQDNLLMDGLFCYDGEDFVNNGEIKCTASELHAAAICDGVGGANSGELASKAAVQAVNHFVQQYRDSDVLLEHLIYEFLDQVNEKIIMLGNKIGKTATTISLVIWKGDQYYAVNIGDSPVYMLRKHKLERLSTPHTMAALKMMEGIPYEPKDRHTLMNYLGKNGVAGSQMASFHHGYLQKGDVFLICSDGVTDKIDRDRLKRYMAKSPEGTVKAIRRTLARSSNNDNCTAIAIKVC